MTWEADNPRFRDAWQTRQEFARGGDSLRPIVANLNIDGPAVAAYSLISPNTPNTPNLLSVPLANPPGLTLLPNTTKLNADNSYWTSGDSILALFSSAWTPAQQLALPNWHFSIQAIIWQIITGIVMQAKNLDVGPGSTQITLLLWIEALPVSWTPATVTFNTQPLCRDTQTSAAGVKSSVNANAPFLKLGPCNFVPGETKTINVDVTNPIYARMLPPTFSFSGSVLTGATNTSLKVNNFPFDSGGVQQLYNTYYNVDNNFIGAVVTVTPYAGDPAMRSPASSIVTAYNSATGVFTLSPALPWVPVNLGGAAIDGVAIVAPIYGYAVRVAALTSPTLVGGVASPFSGSIALTALATDLLAESTGNS